MEKPLQTTAYRPPAEPLPVEAEPGATGAIDPALAATMLPTQLIQPGEVIVLLLKPSPWYIVLACSRTLGVIALLALATLVMARHGWVSVYHRRDLMLLTVGLASLRLFWQLLDWLSQVYVLTDRRVIRVRGVIRVQVFETALKQVQHTSTHFSFRERLFGLGTIGFATASAGGRIEAYWLMLARPLDVHQTVVRTLGRYR